MGSKSHKNPCECIDLYIHIYLYIYLSPHPIVHMHMCVYIYIYVFSVSMGTHMCECIQISVFMLSSRCLMWLQYISTMYNFSKSHNVVISKWNFLPTLKEDFYYSQGYLLWSTSAQDLLIQEKVEKIVNINFQFIKMEWNIFNSNFSKKSNLNKISL